MSGLQIQRCHLQNNLQFHWIENVSVLFYGLVLTLSVCVLDLRLVSRTTTPAMIAYRMNFSLILTTTLGFLAHQHCTLSIINYMHPAVKSCVPGSNMNHGLVKAPYLIKLSAECNRAAYFITG